MFCLVFLAPRPHGIQDRLQAVPQLSLVRGADNRNESKAVHQEPRRQAHPLPPQNRNLSAEGVHPPGGGGAADPGAREAPGKPLYVPLQHHRRDVLPRLRSKAPREDPPRCRVGAYLLPRAASPICQARDKKFFNFSEKISSQQGTDCYSMQKSFIFQTIST